MTMEHYNKTEYGVEVYSPTLKDTFLYYFPTKAEALEEVEQLQEAGIKCSFITTIN